MNGRSRAALAIGITAAAAFGGAGGAALEKGAPHHQVRTTDSAQGPAATTSTTEPATTTTVHVVLDPVFATQGSTSTTTAARTIATTGQVRATSTTLPTPWTCTVTTPANETYGGTYSAQVSTSRPAVHVVGQAVDASGTPAATPEIAGTTDSAGRWSMTYTLPAPRPGQPAGTAPWRVTVRGASDSYPRCGAAMRVSRP